MNKTLAYLALGVGYLAGLSIREGAQSCRDDSWRLEGDREPAVSVQDYNQEEPVSGRDGDLWFVFTTGAIFYIVRKPFKDGTLRREDCR